MLELIDTHTHLDAVEFEEEQDAIILRAKQEGIINMINVGFNRATIPSTIELAQKHSEIYAVIGWHPQDAKDMIEEDFLMIEKQCQNNTKIVAIGEIGLDYYWDTSPKETQQRIFRQQIQLAKLLKKPIVIHNRDAHEDVVKILKEEGAQEVGGIMHSFSGSWEIAKVCLSLGFHLSFGGPITFKNAKQPKEVIKQVPTEQLLIETDCPYLTPHPHRGKRNEPSYIKYIAQEAAELREIEIEELAKITTCNAKKLFQI